MTCPRCTVGDLAEDTGTCILCGFVPGATSTVAVDKPVIDEVQETVQRELDGRFRINVLLRHGSKSAVYLADEVDTNRLVALKVIPLQRGMNVDLASFEREAGVAASLSHAHIVPILGYGHTRALLWYSMEYIKGRSLSDLLRETGPMDLDTCQKILEQIASALDYLHRRSVTHGNVKPDNILVDADRWAMVSDACVMGALRPTSEHGNARVLTGSPEYLAPEQFRARSVGASADQYSLGVVAYECLTGTVPFVGDSPEEMERMHRSEILQPMENIVEDLPEHVSKAVQRALGKTPVIRFATVLDFVAMLRRDWAPQISTANMVPDTRPGSRPSHVFVIDAPKRRLRWFWGLGGTLVVVLAFATYFWFGPWQEPLPIRANAETMATSDGSGELVVDELNIPPTAGEAATQRSVQATEGPVVPATPARQTTTQPRPSVAPPTTAAPTITQIPEMPQAPGELFINSRPWGRVYVDGEFVGNTPQAGLAIAAGVHTIRVLRDGFETYEAEIEIFSGRQRRITNIVLRPRQQ
jgi:serine/threonine protein kinase